jgi:hypothetical protein
MVPFLLAAGVLLVVWVIASDRTRYLTRFDRGRWREPYYLTALPNFLQALHDYNLPQAWPARLNAVSAAYFAYRVRPILKAHPSMRREGFLRQHLNLYAQVHMLRPYINDALMGEELRILVGRVMEMEDSAERDDVLMGEELRILVGRVMEMEDSAERDQLLAFITEMRDYRAAFQATLTKYDRAVIARIRSRGFVPLLAQVHTVCLEHGYTLLPEFDVLRRWQELSASELVRALPALPSVRALRRKAGDAAGPTTAEHGPSPEPRLG